jgi:hydroxylaminobenzene mutase
MQSESLTPHQKSLAASAAWLMVAGLATGLLVAAAMTHQLPANPHALLAAHLNGLMGCFWLLGLAWTLPSLSYQEKTVLLLTRLISLSVWANWGFTLLKAFWQVSGLAYSGDLKNNLIAASLQAFVVLPALAGSALWAWGLHQKKAG